jgi:hypothetical protein
VRIQRTHSRLWLSRTPRFARCIDLSPHPLAHEFHLPASTLALPRHSKLRRVPVTTPLILHFWLRGAGTSRRSRLSLVTYSTLPLLFSLPSRYPRAPASQLPSFPAACATPCLRHHHTTPHPPHVSTTATRSPPLSHPHPHCNPNRLLPRIAAAGLADAPSLYSPRVLLPA